MSEYQELDPVRHMLQNPERDLGDCTVHMVQRYLLDIEKMKVSLHQIPYNTAVERLYQEILYNAIDNVERSREEGIDPGSIKVWMSKDTIRVRNEGKPISCGIQPNRDIHKPEFIFSNLLTGSNFGGSSRKVQTVGGKFGIGSKATNIFSSYFNIEIVNDTEEIIQQDLIADNGTVIPKGTILPRSLLGQYSTGKGVKYRQTWKNNMFVKFRPEESDTPDMRQEKARLYRESVAPIIEETDEKSYTQITFVVDFGKFYDADELYGFSGQRSYTNPMLLAFGKHCIDASATGNVKVFFNGKEINCTNTNSKGEYKDGLSIIRYARFFFPELPQYLLFKSTDSYCLLLDTPGNGNTISFVNGVINEEGGVHVDSWRKALFKGIVRHCKKKIKGFKCKDTDVAMHISMILLCRLNNPVYKSQTKDKVTSPKPHIALVNTQGKNVDMERLLAWDAVKRIEEIGRMRINMIAKGTDGTMKKMVDSHKLMDAAWAGDKNEGPKCTLIITEGDGAANFAIKGIDNGGYTGALPIKGKLLNVGTCDEHQYAGNAEIAEMKKALALREGHDYSTVDSRRQLRYGRLIIMSDQDRDGAHIRMLVLNFFRHKFPSLLQRTVDGVLDSFVSIMETPYMRVKDRDQVIPFFYERQYDEWIRDITISDQERQRRLKCDVKFFKGLGSSSDMELLEAFKIGQVITPIWDDKAEELMSIAFDEGNEDERKEWLMSWNPESKEGLHAKNFPADTISHLVTNQLCEFSWVNALRSTPSIVDGLKECQRKVLTVVLGMSKEKKVSQLKGLVSDQMHYRYGDEALYRTIVGMGNYCVGTNNVPLIKAKGQYDSRLGKKAAPDRYIYAARSPVLKYLFRKEDTCILEYQYEGKDKIEPRTYYPILPPWAINGSRGIGTGFSTNIPAHNPVDIMKYIVWWLKIKTGQITSSPFMYHDKITGEYRQGKNTSKGFIPYEAPPELAPWYRNYQGQIVKIGNDWFSIGSYETIPSRKVIKDIHVTEIPVTQTIDTYIEKMKKMKEKTVMKDSEWEASKSEKKCPTWISGYKAVPRRMTYKYKGERYIEILPSILIEKPLCLTAFDTSPLRVLGLIEKISDTNITLLDEHSRPHQYGGRKTCVLTETGDQAYVVSGMMNALDRFCEIRYQAYTLRRHKMMSQWKESIDRLEQQKRFIQAVIDGVITFKGSDNRMKKKQILINEITELGYPSEFGDISIFTLTEDGIEKVDKDIAVLQAKYDDYQSSSPGDLWFREMHELYNHL